MPSKNCFVHFFSTHVYMYNHSLLYFSRTNDTPCTKKTDSFIFSLVFSRFPHFSPTRKEKKTNVFNSLRNCSHLFKKRVTRSNISDPYVTRRGCMKRRANTISHFHRRSTVRPVNRALPGRSVHLHVFPAMKKRKSKRRWKRGIDPDRKDKIGRMKAAPNV